MGTHSSGSLVATEQRNENPARRGLEREDRRLADAPTPWKLKAAYQRLQAENDLLKRRIAKLQATLLDVKRLLAEIEAASQDGMTFEASPRGEQTDHRGFEAERELSPPRDGSSASVTRS